MQTHDTASVVGLRDRGLIREGLRADLNLIDMEKLRLNAPFMIADLPTGAQRWMQTAEGIVMTLCKGVATWEHGRATGALPRRPESMLAEPDRLQWQRHDHPTSRACHSRSYD